MLDLNKLKIEIDKAKELLDNPEPGLYTWNMFLALRLKAIKELLRDLK